VDGRKEVVVGNVGEGVVIQAAVELWWAFLQRKEQSKGCEPIAIDVHY